MHNHRTVAAIAAASLLAAFAANATKGAVYQAPAAEPEYPRFTITGGAMYMKPDLNGLDYLTTGFDNGTEEVVTTYSVDPNYQWGYYVALGYMISDRYDVQASWAQLDTNSSDSTFIDSTDSDITFATSNQLGYGLDGDTLTAYSNESLNYQVFDATLGQYHTLGENLMTRVFAGVRYAKINNKTTNDYADFDPDDSDTFAITDYFNSEFSGWGPEVGLDVNYEVYDWFGIVGHFAAAFLIGEQESYSDVYTSGYAEGKSSNEGRMIPALDAKLGLTFGVPFMDFMDMQDRIVLEAGYEVAYYFNVIDQVQYQYDYTNNYDYTYIAIHNYSDVGIMGPYANLSVKF